MIKLIWREESKVQGEVCPNLQGLPVRAKQKLDEMNLLDDFLFGTLVSYPELGEQFSRILLKTIFKKEFGKLTVIPQKVFYGEDTVWHGARLDVYLEEDEVVLAEQAAIYNVEADKNDGADDIRALPRRVRFYHAIIDSKSLASGQDYQYMRDVFVILITPYDPFGLNRMVYTISNKCEEVPEMPYEDGAKTIFLYTKGSEGSPGEELRQFLHYMEETTMKNAVNETLQELQRMVDIVKQDGEVRLNLMKSFERDNKLIEQGREQGMIVNIQNLMENMKCTMQYAMDMLGIPEADRERYKKKIERENDGD